MEIIPCTHATFLMTKREEHVLSLREKIQLYIHLAICEFCRRFLKQTKLIEKASKNITSDEKLSAEEKNRMKELFNLS